MSLTNKQLVVVGIIAGIAALAIMIGFIGRGNVRHVTIFWQEKVEQTVVFQDVDVNVQLSVI